MVTVPIWFYIFALIFVAVISVFVGRQWFARREVVKWEYKIDRISNYWMHKLKGELESCDAMLLPKYITIIVDDEDSEPDNKNEEKIEKEK